MNRAEKTKLAEDLKQKFQSSVVCIFADYKGMTAPQADEFRKTLRGVGASVKVVKNNVARHVVKDGSFGEEARQVLDGVVGPTLVAFAQKDAAAVAKAVHQYAKSNEALQLKDSLMGRKRITPKDIESLANLPSREVLVAMLLGVFNGPARGFVTVLSAVPRGLVTVLSQIEKKKAQSV